MNHSLLKKFINKVLFLILFVSFFATYNNEVKAQQWTIAGCSGTLGSNLYGPMYSTATANSTNRYATIYPASQLAGLANKSLGEIYFSRFTTSGSMAGTPNLKIYLKHVSNTDFGAGSITWATEITGATLVYDGNPASIIGSDAGWKGFPFVTSFFYNGTDNLALYTEYTNSTASTAITWVYEYTSPCVATGNNNTGKYTNNTTGTLPATLATSNYRRPYIAFDFTAPPCVAPPTAGNANVSETAVCSGATVELSLTGNSVGSGQKYQWQSASSISGPYTNLDTAINVPTKATQITSNTYFRCIATCSGQSDTSDTVNVSIRSQLLGGTYTINQSMPTGSGNFENFKDAQDAIKCGITGPIIFNVENDTYVGSINLSDIAGLSATNTITFNGNGSTLIDTLTASKPDYILQLKNVSYVTFDNFNFIAHSSSTKGIVVVLTDAHHNTIKNSKIEGDQASTGTAFSAVAFTGASNSTSTATNATYNTFENNDISGGYYTVRLNGTTATRNILGNKFINNTVRDFYGYGFYISAADSTQIVGNDIHRLNRMAGSVTTGYGVYYTTNTKKSYTANNRIHDLVLITSTTGTNGIYFTSNDAPSGSENWVVNNLIYNIATGGSNYGIYNSSSDGVFSYFNTIAIEHPTATAGLAYGLYQITSAVGVQYKNNIVYINKGGSGAKYAIYLSTTGSTITSDNNVLYVNTAVAGSGVKNIGYWGAAFISMSDWQNANTNAFDQASVNANPLFVNSSQGNLKPGNIDVNNVGTVISSITQDFFGETRNAINPDAGAIEFTIFNNDIGVVSLNSLGALCSGTHDVKVRVKNFGGNAVNGFTVNWSVNNVLQTPLIWGPGTLPVLTDTPVIIGSYAFVQNTPYDIKVWTSSPNGFADADTTNDQILVNDIKVGLSGTLTVGASGADYTSIAAAAADLTASGVCGPVIIDVNPAGGPYTDQILIGSIPGISSVNNVYFKGNGSVINYIPNISANRAVFSLNASKHITIDSFVINGVTTSTSEYVWGIYASSGSDSNIIKNNRINLGVNSTSLNHQGIVFSGSATSATTGGLFKFNKVENNIIDGGYYGITFYGTATFEAQSKGNEIRNNVVNNSYARAISVAYADSTQITYNNLSMNDRTSYTTYYGIYLLGGTSAPVNNTYINGNTIRDLFTKNKLSTSTTNGIYITGADADVGKENMITNNIIYNYENSGSNYGIYNSAGNGTHVFHNSISINNMATSAGTARGIYFTGNQNNIIVKNNAVQIVKGTGVGFKAALTYSDSTSIVVSDYNALFTGGTAEVYVGSYGGTAYGNLSGYQSASKKDSNSFFANPQYNASNVLIPRLGSPLIGAGTALANVTTDYLGQPRSLTNPSIGAFELSQDLTAPNISYLPIANVSTGANYVLQDFAIITDTSTIDTAYLKRPRIYYKKSTNANTFVDNTSATNGWKYSISTSVDTPFSFVIDHSRLFGGSLAVGDEIQYFVIAQDTALPNVGYANAVFTNHPSSVQLDSTNFPVTGTLSYFRSSFVSGVFNVGNGQPFTSLTKDEGAFEFLNSAILTGDVTLVVTSNLSENGTHALNQPVESGAGNYKIKIVPNGDTLRTISGSYVGGLIRLNGADRVTIDGAGSNNGRYFKFQNTSTVTNTATIQLISLGAGLGAKDITIRNSMISSGTIGGPTVHSFGIYAGSQAISATGDGEDFDNLLIENDSVDRALQAIYIAGSTGAVNNNVRILNNVLGSTATSNYLYYAGINIRHTDTALIKGNRIMNANASGTTFSEFNNPKGIFVNTGTINTRVTQNNITGIKYTTLAGYGARGIHINTGNPTSNDTIDNNMMGDILGDGWNLGNAARDLIAGLMIQGGNTGGLKIWYNSVDLQGQANNADAGINQISAALFVDTTVTDLDIRNNTFSNAIVNTANANAKAYAVYSRVPSSAYTLFNNNNFYVSGTQGIIGFLGVDLPTLSDLQIASSSNINSISVNPKFVSNTDLHSSGPNLFGKGVAIAAISTDIDGDARVNPPCIGADEFTVPQVDLKVKAILYPNNNICGNATDSVIVIIENVGLSSQNNFQVKANITGTITASVSKTYTKTIVSGEVDTISIGYFNSNGPTGDTYVSAFTDLTSESNRANDTITVKREILATPNAPTLVSISSACINTSATVIATKNIGKIYWFDSPNSTTAIDEGDTLQTPTLNAPTTFYMEASSMTLNRNSVGAVSNSIGLGGYTNLYTYALTFDVLKNVNIDTISVIAAAGTGNITVRFRDQANAVTLHTSVFTGTTTEGQVVRIPINFSMTPGSYRVDAVGSAGINIYRNTDGSSFPYTVPGTITLTGHTFSGYPQYYYFFYNWKVSSGVAGCSSPRVPVLVTPTNGPTGAQVVQSTPFEGTFNAGTLGNPDGACVGNTLTYTLTAPTGFNTADLGTTWAVLNPKVLTKGGATPAGSIMMSGLNLTYVAAAGDLDSTLIFTASIKNLTTGCETIISRHLKVYNGPSVNIGQNQTVCPGTFIALDAGNVGSTYLWNTGATTQTISVSLPGTYSVVVTGAGGCKDSASMVLSNNSAIQVNLGPDKGLCVGASMVLDAGLVSGASYLWSNGQTTSSIEINSPGTYFVMVTGINGCSTRDTINISSIALPVVNLGLDQSVCTDQSVTLDAGNVGSTYLWNTGATTQTIVASAAGTYTVTVTSPAGCSASDAVVVNHKATPNAEFTHTQVQGLQVQFAATFQLSNQQYEWDFGDPTSPSNTSFLRDPNHLFTDSGTYTVTLTITNVSTSCVSVVSKTIYVDKTVGTENTNASTFNMYAAPNPFAGSTKIKYTLPENANSVSINVYDMLGRKVSSIVSNEQQNAGAYEFDFVNVHSENASGVYIVRLIVDGKENNIRVIDVAKK